MSDGSAIEWTDATWNPLLGCSKVSEGCRNCYAIRTSYRAAHLPHTAKLYQGLTVKRADGSLNWTGEVRLVPERLRQPLGWKKPRRVFVNSQSDLFHEQVPDEFIDRVFAVMALTPRHTYQVLTKRPERMARWVAGGTDTLNAVVRAAERIDPSRAQPTWAAWPLPNVWLGTSTEDQRTADERIPHLLATPAAVRFLSCEPLLGPVRLPLAQMFGAVRPTGNFRTDETRGVRQLQIVVDRASLLLHWVIAGSESGPGARPCDLDWVRGLRDQCSQAGVSFFWKQHVVEGRKIGLPELDGRVWAEFPTPVVPVAAVPS